MSSRDTILTRKVDSAFDVLTAHRKVALGMVLLFAFMAMSGGRFLQFNMDYRVFFGGHNPYLEEYQRQQRTYARNDNILMAIEPTTDSVFNYDLLKIIRRYTHEAWQLPSVTRVDSLTNFQDSFAFGNELIIRDLVSDEVDFSQALLQYVEKVSLSEPVLVNRLVSSNGRYTGVALTVHLPEGVEKNEKIIEIVREARALAERLEREDSVKKVYLSGTVMINNAFYEVSKNDVITLIPIMFLVIIVAMTMLIRSLGATMVVFAKVGLAVGVSFGLAALSGIELTPPSAAAAPIIMMLSIADSIHILTQYYKYMNRGDTAGDRHASMKKSLRANFVPVSLTTLTTVIGFLTMNFSESPPFKDLGNMVAMGAIAGYILTLTFLPLLVIQLKVKKARRDSVVITRNLEYLANWVIKKRTVLVISTFVMVGFLGFFISKNTLNDEFVKYFDTSIKFRTDNDFITHNLTGIYQIEYSLSAASEGGISDTEYLQTVEAFAHWFRQQRHVMHVQTVSDIYKKANMNLHEGSVEYYRIPESRELAAQALLAYELSLPPGLDLNDQINVAKSAAKFVVSLRTIPARDLVALETAADAWLQQHAPEFMKTAVGTGPAVLFSHIGMRSIKTGLIGGVVALLLICAILSLVFRSIKLGLISVIPNLFPAAMAFGVWGIVNGQINMALATVLSMTLGIIVDDTIHFINKYREGIRQDYSPEDAVRQTFSVVGLAIVVTTLVLVAGFCVLMFSPFVMNWGMGLLSAITILFALITDLVLLPAFLIQYERRKTDEIPLVSRASA